MTGAGGLRAEGCEGLRAQGFKGSSFFSGRGLRLRSLGMKIYGIRVRACGVSGLGC